MVLPALIQLGAEQSTHTGSALLGFAVSGDSDGAEVVVQVNDIDPSEQDEPVRAFLRINFSPTTDTTDPAAETLPGSAPDFGGSIVFGGTLAESLESCDDNHFVITRNLAYEDLLPEEKRVAVEFYRGAEASGTEDLRDASDALIAADTGDYTVVRPDVWFRYGNWSMSSDGGEERGFDGFFNYTTCSFNSNAYWSKQGVRETFTFPSVAAVSGRLDALPAVLESQWRMQLIPSAYESLIRSDITSSRLESGAQALRYEGESWSDARPAVTLRSSSLVFENRSAKQERDVWIFIAGIGVSILGGLFATLIAWAVLRSRSTQMDEISGVPISTDEGDENRGDAWRDGEETQPVPPTG